MNNIIITLAECVALHQSNKPDENTVFLLYIISVPYIAIIYKY